MLRSPSWGGGTTSVRALLESAARSPEARRPLPQLLRSRAERAESERLQQLLDAAPDARTLPSKERTHAHYCSLPSLHHHFTLPQGRLLMHRNLRLPLDTPSDMEQVVPRAWKLEQSRGRKQFRPRRPSPSALAAAAARPNAQTLSQSSHAAAAAAPTAPTEGEFALSGSASASVLAAPAPRGMSGLPSGCRWNQAGYQGRR